MADHPIDLGELQRLVSALAAAKKERERAQQLMDALELKGGKQAVYLTLTVTNERGGDRQEHAFRLINADLYSHQVARGREPLLMHIQRFAREQLIDQGSKVEGLEFQIRRLTK